MSRNILIAIAFVIALYALPQYTQASSLDFAYDTEFKMGALINGKSVSQGGSVLGASTDSTGKVKVTSKLDKKRTSYYKDISISSPKGWYTTEDAKDWYITDKAEEGMSGLVTEINNEEMTAGISITRFDAENKSLAEYAAEVEKVCAQCDHKILSKGVAKVAGQKGKFIDVSDKDHRIKIYIFISDETVYFVQLTTKEKEWKHYQKILGKSVKTLKLR